jgi:hypothetical protein
VTSDHKMSWREKLIAYRVMWWRPWAARRFIRAVERNRLRIEKTR